MPKLVMTHGVADVKTWLSFKKERAESSAVIGGLNAMDLSAQDGSRAVAVRADVDDPAVPPVVTVVPDLPVLSQQVHPRVDLLLGERPPVRAGRLTGRSASSISVT